MAQQVFKQRAVLGVYGNADGAGRHDFGVTQVAGLRDRIEHIVGYGGDVITVLDVDQAYQEFIAAVAADDV